MPSAAERLRFWSTERFMVRMRGLRWFLVGPIGMASWVGTVAVLAVGVSLLSGCLFATQQRGPVIMFMGNSITRNAPVPDLNWTGDWGMAASSLERDYVHQTIRLLKEKKLEAIPVLADRDCPDCDGGIDEQIHNMDQVRKVQPRFVVVQLSEHSGEIELRSGKMTAQYRELLLGLQQAGVPHVYCLGAWGEKDVDQPHNDGIRRALGDFPEYAFVDISKVVSDTANYGDPNLFTDAGVLWHPGDRGMLGIAAILSQKIWEDR